MRGDLIRFVTRLARRPRALMHEYRLWLFSMSLNGRLGAPMLVERFLRLGIGIALAAFHTREVAFAAASRGA